MSLYRVLHDEKKLQAFRATAFAEHFHEVDLENWIEQNPSALVSDEPLLVIGRQVQTGDGIIDLLALDSDGATIVAELKRAPAQREALSQVIEYGAWVSSLDSDAIERVANEYLGRGQRDRRLDHAWTATFNTGLPRDALNSGQRLHVIVEGDDRRLIAMTSFLRSCGVDITLLAYNFYRTDGGEQIMDLRRLVGDEDDARTPSRARHRPSEQDVVGSWPQRSVDAFRTLQEILLAHGLVSKAKKTNISFSLQTREDLVFICNVHASKDMLVTWLRSDTLRSRLDFDAAISCLRGALSKKATLKTSPTWTLISCPADDESAALLARSVISCVCERLA